MGWLSEGFHVNSGDESLLQLASTNGVLALPDQHSAATKRWSSAVSVARLTADKV